MQNVSKSKMFKGFNSYVSSLKTSVRLKDSKQHDVVNLVSSSSGHTCRTEVRTGQRNQQVLIVTYDISELLAIHIF